MPRILLILRAMHARIIRHADHHAGVYAGIRDGEQRVCRDVEPHMLHAAKAALSRKGSAKRGFHSNFFIRRPFRIDLRIFGRRFADFRAGRSRIAGKERTTSLV